MSFSNGVRPSVNVAKTSNILLLAMENDFPREVYTPSSIPDEYEFMSRDIKSTWRFEEKMYENNPPASIKIFCGALIRSPSGKSKCQ